MTRHRYDPACPLCRPALIDARTGEVLPPHAIESLALMVVWNAATFEEREAFINVTVFDSRDATDVERADSIMRRFKAQAERSRLVMTKGGDA